MLGGLGRIAPFVLASSLVHGAVLVGVVDRAALPLSPPGQASTLSVRLVRAGEPKPAHEATHGVARAVPTRPATTTASPRAGAAPAHGPSPAARAEGASGDDADTAGRHDTSTARAEAATTEAGADVSPPAPANASGDQGAPTQTDTHPATTPARAAPAPDPAEQQAQANPPDPVEPGHAGEASRSQRARRARSAIRRELAQHFYYPRLARRRGWQGRVVLRMEVAPDGRIAHVRVRDSSGRTVLDDAARRAVRRIERLPGLTDTLAGRRVALDLPVDYRLR